MTKKRHTLEQGQRVHYLANLGGLVSIAGLEHYDPELLLGVFLEIAVRLPHLSGERHAALREQGRGRLAERGGEKRAWRAYQHTHDVHQVVLTTIQLQRAIRHFGESPPQDTTELVSLFTALLRGETDGAT